MSKHLLKCTYATALAFTLSATAQPVIAQASCLTSFEDYLSMLPAFSAPVLQNVVKSIREDSAVRLQSAREGRLSASEIPRHEQQIQTYSNNSREHLANHIRQGGQLSEALCNPPQGYALGWAATQMGIAFHTWSVNTVRCAKGEGNFAPVPQFCPWATQPNALTPNPAPRDDPKVFGRSARGG